MLCYFSQVKLVMD